MPLKWTKFNGICLQVSEFVITFDLFQWHFHVSLHFSVYHFQRHGLFPFLCHLVCPSISEALPLLSAHVKIFSFSRMQHFYTISLLVFIIFKKRFCLYWWLKKVFFYTWLLLIWGSSNSPWSIPWSKEEEKKNRGLESEVKVIVCWGERKPSQFAFYWALQKSLSGHYLHSTLLCINIQF